MCNVLFQPDGLRTKVSAGTLLTDAMMAAGIAVQLTCGGTGKCGKCAVEIHPDPPEPNDFDRLHLSASQLAKGIRLACQTRIDRDMSVLIPDAVRVLDGKILVDGADRLFDLAPSVAKTYVELPQPTLEDQAADLYRIKRALGMPDETCPGFDIDLLRDLSAILRAADFKVTVVTCGGRIIAVEPGDTTGTRYGISFDIGTTTVVGTIVDLSTGRTVSHASRLNAQVVHGEDTISRIQHAITASDGRRDMYEKIRDVMNGIIADAAEKAGIAADSVYEAVLAGNTTMSHLFLGLDPTGLSQIPFVPVSNAAVDLRASDAGIAIHPRGNVHVLPNIAGFVGSDTVGVMLACNYLDDGGPSQLAVDVGTNGELAVRHKGELMVCSTAAGPALEGAALRSGMRAANGAIEHVRITPERVECDVIGDSRPIGVCGSGIIDLVAELLNAGVVDQYGAIGDPESLRGRVYDHLIERIVTVDDQPAFVVSRGDGGDGGRDVLITQRDVRQIQLAKGAIAAGITLILREMDLSPDDLDEILLAGAFGNYIDKKSAQRIGLLPKLPLEKIRFVGNAASTGAKMALLSMSARSDADRIRFRTRHLELANLPGFMNELSDSMLFP